MAKWIPGVFVRKLTPYGAARFNLPPGRWWTALTFEWRGRETLLLAVPNG